MFSLVTSMSRGAVSLDGPCRPASQLSVAEDYKRSSLIHPESIS